MLKVLRKKNTSKIIWSFLTVVIIIAFGLGGYVTRVLRSPNEKEFAGKISGRIISSLEFKEAVLAVRDQAVMQFGDKLSEVQKYLNFDAQAWERIILLEEAKKRKITASDEEVVELIKGYTFFQNNGQFDNRVYLDVLKYYFRSQPRTFEEETRQNIIISKFYKQITNKISLSENEIKEEYRKLNQELTLDFIVSAPADFAKNLSPSDAEINTFFNNNSFMFKEAPSFNLEYYTCDSEEKIREIQKRINKRIPPDKISKEVGVEIKETGPFPQTGPVPGMGWSPEVLDMISRLRVGQYSNIIQMDKYYYIVRLKEKKDAFIPEFKEIKDKVKQALISDLCEKKAKEKIEECLALLKKSYQQNPKSVDFAKTAKECGLKQDSTAAFKYGSYIEGIGASDNFWLLADSLKDNEFSNAIESATGLYIIKVKSRGLFDEKKFAAEKEDFGKKLLLQKKQDTFVKFIEGLKTKTQKY